MFLATCDQFSLELLLMVGPKNEGYWKKKDSNPTPGFLSCCFSVIWSITLTLPGVGSTRAAVISLQDFPGPGNSGFSEATPSASTAIRASSLNPHRQNWTGIEQKCVLSHAQQLRAGFKCKWDGEDYGNSIEKALWGSFHPAQIVRKSSGCPETSGRKQKYEIRPFCLAAVKVRHIMCIAVWTHLFQLLSLHPTRRSSQETSAPVQTFSCLPVGIDLWPSSSWCKRCPLSEVALPGPCLGDGWSRSLFAFQLSPTTAAASAGRGMVVIWVNSFP